SKTRRAFGDKRRSFPWLALEAPVDASDGLPRQEVCGSLAQTCRATRVPFKQGYRKAGESPRHRHPPSQENTDTTAAAQATTEHFDLKLV
ncbi:MAG TPA: hypothetical protein VIM34_08155, partial [Burkholderiaceae bacterium]